MKKRSLGLAAFAILLLVTSLPAATIVATLPEYNGAGSFPATEFIGTFTYTIPVGELILSATVSGTLGNSAIPNTAVMDVLVDGLKVASCTSPASPCWSGAVPLAWNYSFAPSEFSALLDGMADLTVNQIDCCIVRLGVSTLVIETGVIPEPSTYLLFGAGLAGIALLRRRFSR